MKEMTMRRNVDLDGDCDYGDGEGPTQQKILPGPVQQSSV